MKCTPKDLRNKLSVMDLQHESHRRKGKIAEIAQNHVAYKRDTQHDMHIHASESDADCICRISLQCCRLKAKML